MQKNTCRAVLAAYLLIFLLPSLSADGQERPHRRSWEFGLGGSVSNLTRTTLTGFRQTQGGDYVFDLEDRHLYGGLDLYAATALRKWLWLDVQGSLGKVRYYESGGRRSGGSLLLEPGIQIRPVVSSAWIQPYVRAGIGYFGKDFPLRYFGTFEGDVTGEALWRAEDAWNKGYTFDHDHSFPLSAGVGFIGWFGNRVGMRLQGEYLHSLNASGVNFARISAGLVLGLGGPDRRKAEADRYVSRHPSAYDGFYAGRLPEKVVEKEVVREVPVERIVERVVEKDMSEASETVLAELMDHVNFDFDKATLSDSSAQVLDAVARTLLEYPGTRFLICGYTDSRGSETYNAALSLERARTVWQALVDRGVPSDRLAFRGFGKRVSLMPESASEELRRVDRKVILERILDDDAWQYLKSN